MFVFRSFSRLSLKKGGKSVARKSSAKSFFDTLGEVDAPSTANSTYHSTLPSTLSSPPPPSVDVTTSKKFVDPLTRFDPGVYKLVIRNTLGIRIIWYSDHGDLFDCQMVRYCITMVVSYLDHHSVKGPIFRPSVCEF